MKKNMKIKLIFGAALIVALGLGVSVATGSLAPSASKATASTVTSTATQEVQATVASAENLYEAVSAPPENVGSNTASTDSGPRPSPSTLGGGSASLPFPLRDDPNGQPVAMLSPTGDHAGLSTAEGQEMMAEATADLGSVYDAALVKTYSSLVGTDVKIQSAGQMVFGSAGATVVNVVSTTLSTDNASAAELAVVSQWVDVGNVSSSGEVEWALHHAYIDVKDTLVNTDGKWLVSARHWRYAQGNGPGGGTSPTSTFPTKFPAPPASSTGQATTSGVTEGSTPTGS